MKPTAAPYVWPMPGHRTMAEVMRDERLVEHQRNQVGKEVGFAKWQAERHLSAVER